jgi:hypothetical protein
MFVWQSEGILRSLCKLFQAWPFCLFKLYLTTELNYLFIFTVCTKSCLKW